LGEFVIVVVTDERFLLLISDWRLMEGVVPLLCAGITTYSPLRHWKAGNGHKVGILGLGGLGRTL
jgi:alcohol dehydrogenase (NADP+)